MRLKEQFSATIRPVNFVDGCWSVLQDSGEVYSIRLAGLPVISFMPGWHPRALIDLGLKTHLLELIHDNGQKATWFLDETYNHLTDRIESLSAQLRDNLIETLFEPLEEVYTKILSAIHPVESSVNVIPHLINEDTIKKIINNLIQKKQFLFNVITSQILREQFITIKPDNRSIKLAYLDNIFQVDAQKSIESALSDSYLRCLSPVSGLELRSSHSLAIHEHRMAFRFIDPDHNFVFYVSMTHHTFKIADLYIPAADTAFTILPDDRRTPNASLMLEYLTHFVTHHQKILSYFRTSHTIPAVVCRGYPGMHIGHQLWNELTAYERLLRHLDRTRLPVIVVPNADRGSEAYGPMDMLFPEWAGRVDRSLRTESETLGEFVYRKSYLLFRALDEHVTTGLSERLIQFAQTASTTSVSRTRIAELIAQGFTLVTLGLRVENRTAINLYDVLEQTITHIARNVPKLAVVIDGHNSRLNGDPATAFDSFGQSAASNPILMELQLAIRLRQRFEYTGVKIVNTIGSSVLDSIVWVKASVFFVAIWGAGLAKYRWACNKTGLVMLSRSNLLLRHDLHIYDSPEFQESPSPVLYLDPYSVTDSPEVPVLFSPANPVPASYANFRVDCVKLLPQIDTLLEMAGIQSVPDRLEHSVS